MFKLHPQLTTIVGLYSHVFNKLLQKIHHTCSSWSALYRVVQKTDPLTCFCNNFGKCTPILVLFSLLQHENYGAQNLCYFSHHTFIIC